MGTPSLHIENHIATISLERPEKANSLTQEDLRQLRQCIAQIDADPEVLVARIVARGRHFCGGYDISSLAELSPGAEVIEFGDVVDALENIRPVTIAAIHGGVYGGATDLCLACDFRVGVAHAEMFMPAALLGVHYYQGGLQRYVSRLGLNAAKRLFLTAEKIDAQTMLELGFLTEIVEPDSLAERVDALSQTIARLAPIPLLGMKKHLNRIARGTLDAEELERDIARAQQSMDLREGTLAWKEKRAPRFTGS